MISTGSASAEWWYNKYCVNYILKGKEDKWFVKRRLIKDYYDSLVVLSEILTNKFTESPVEVKRKVHNVFRNGVMKWCRICKLFDSNEDLKDFLKPRDILEVEADNSVLKDILQQELEKKLDSGN